jgi:hypothetical protein
MLAQIAMSVLRTFHRPQRLYNGAHIRTRGLKSLALGRQFRILFMGRDEFSCLVLAELFKAKGMSNRPSCISHQNIFLRLIKLVDVWEEIIIATQPDMYVGRRKSILSVCKSGFGLVHN